MPVRYISIHRRLRAAEECRGLSAEHSDLDVHTHGAHEALARLRDVVDTVQVRRQVAVRGHPLHVHEGDLPVRRPRAQVQRPEDGVGADLFDGGAVGRQTTGQVVVDGVEEDQGLVLSDGFANLRRWGERRGEELPSWVGNTAERRRKK